MRVKRFARRRVLEYFEKSFCVPESTGLDRIGDARVADAWPLSSKAVWNESYDLAEPRESLAYAEQERVDSLYDIAQEIDLAGGGRMLYGMYGSA
jgi:hypothetical protein